MQNLKYLKMFSLFIIALFCLAFSLPTIIDAKITTKNFGPFKKVELLEDVGSETMEPYPGFKYTNAQGDFLWLNGKIYGPYPKIIGHFITKNTVAFVYKNKYGKYYFFLNNKAIGPFTDLGDNVQIKVAKNNWAIQYTNPTELKKNGGGAYIIINGQTMGPYGVIPEFETSYTSWAFIYSHEPYNYESFFVKTPKNTLGPFKKAYSIDIYNDDLTFLSSEKEDLNNKNDSQIWVTLHYNKQTFGPFNFTTSFAPDIEGGKLKYFGQHKDGFYYFYEGNNISQPYEKIKPIQTIYNKEILDMEDQKKGLRYLNLADSRKNIIQLMASFLPSLGLNNIRLANYIFELSGKKYAHLNGKQFGPYDDIESIITSDRNFIMSAVNNGKYFVISENSTYGPYDEVIFSSNPISGSSFGFLYKNNNQAWANINDKIYGPYDIKTSKDKSGTIWENYGEIYMDGKAFAFSYYKNKQSFVNINGRIYGPFQTDDIYTIGVNHIYLTEGKFSFIKINKGKFTINFNGVESTLCPEMGEAIVKKDYWWTVCNDPKKQTSMSEQIIYNGKNMGTFQTRWGTNDTSLGLFVTNEINKNIYVKLFQNK